MRTALASLLFSCCFAFSVVVAAQQEQKQASLGEAHTAIDANLRTAEGKAYDAQFGKAFLKNEAADLHQCKSAAGNGLRSFWILLRIEKDGSASEILLYPETKLGVCARASLLHEKYPAPPRGAYWVGVYLKLAH